MEDIQKFRLFNKLKLVYRFNSVGKRKESSAEHSWSCLLLADFFLSKYDFAIDRLKVYELLMYHDVVEIETGDVPLHPEIQRYGKKEKELAAKKLLHKQLPAPLNDKFVNLFAEFEEQNTIEAKFAKAIDALDAEIHELDYKEDWKSWTEEFLINKKLEFVQEFPELKTVFFELLDYLKTNGYFNQ